MHHIASALRTMPLVLLIACTGAVEGERPIGTPPDLAPPISGPTLPPPQGTRGPDAREPVRAANAGPPARLRRLTRAQVAESLRDLLGTARVDEFEPDEVQDGFASIAVSHVALSPRGVEQLEAAVRASVDAAFADTTRRAGLLSCTPKQAADDACLRTFVEAFGRRAWRRPLAEEETRRFVDLGGTIARSFGDFWAGARHATSALLQSPQFLYRVERAEIADPAAPSRRRYDSWAMASRLSFLLWGTTPDDELLAAAARKELETADGVRAAASRLLRSARATALPHLLAEELIRLSRLETMAKDTRLFPMLTPALRASMADEVKRLFARSLETGVDVRTLFDTTETVVGPELARLYGLAAPTGTTPTRVSLPANGTRAGLLGTAGVLALFSKQAETSPTARGVFIRSHLLCQEVPPPPPGTDTDLGDDATTLTTRQRFEKHRESPACAACHALFDPMGFTLESFDALGVHRTQERGRPIDTSAVVDGTPLNGARELGRWLRESETVRRCLVRAVYTIAQGQKEETSDEPTIETLDAGFKEGGRLPQLLLDLVASDAFRFARVSTDR